MRVRCPGCGTIYGVDPDKVPEGGVRARCAQCPTVFHVGGAGEQPSSDPSDSAEAVGGEVLPERPVGSASTADPGQTQERPPYRSNPAESPVYDMGGGEDAHSEGSHDAVPPAFGSGDPHERARRLARALVSDIATYHGDRLDRGLRNGNLRLELGTEIRKSWDEYTTQVGNQIARETSYFRDALNEILARGARHF